LIPDAGEVRERIADRVEILLAHGDLLEIRHTNVDGSDAWLIHTAPPAFVRRSSGSVLLLGVAPDGSFPLPDRYLRGLRYRGHARVLDEEPGEDLVAYLADLGLMEVTHETWLKAPSAQGHARSRA
jgi:hypothetical protein